MWCGCIFSHIIKMIINYSLLIFKTLLLSSFVWLGLNIAKRLEILCNSSVFLCRRGLLTIYMANLVRWFSIASFQFHFVKSSRQFFHTCLTISWQLSNCICYLSLMLQFLESCDLFKEPTANFDLKCSVLFPGYGDDFSDGCHEGSR